MARLNQIIAIEKNVKATSNRNLTDVYQKLEKADLFAGLSRTYKPKADDGDVYPPESKKVQLTVGDVIKSAKDALVELFNVTGTKDVTNTIAVADVVVDGKVLVKNAPATYLIFLEKQLVDLHTFISKLPVLSPDERWSVNEATGLFATDPAFTVKTKKVPRNHVVAAATDKHPAQVQVYNEDVVEGNWTLVKFSGAIPLPQRNEYLAKVEKLQKAVKFAREQANLVEAVNFAPGKEILDFIF